MLDILVLWENNHLMPDFTDTHIGYAGELTTPQLLEIIETCAIGLRDRNSMCAENGALFFAPLCTHFVRGAKCGRLNEAISKLTNWKSKGKQLSANKVEAYQKKRSEEDIFVSPTCTVVQNKKKNVQARTFRMKTVELLLQAYFKLRSPLKPRHV